LAMDKTNSKIFISDFNKILKKYPFNYLYFDKDDKNSRLWFHCKRNRFQYNIFTLIYRDKNKKIVEKNVENYIDDKIYLLIFYDKNKNEVFDKWEFKKIKINFIKK